MPWLRVDDIFPECEDMDKIFQDYPQHYANCMGLWLAASCYARRNLTDGFIASAKLRRLLPSHRLVHTCRKILVKVGLWEEVDGGILIHNHLKYNPSKVEVLAKREKETEKKRKQRHKGSPQGSPQGTEAGVPTLPSHPIPINNLTQDQGALSPGAREAPPDSSDWFSTDTIAEIFDGHMRQRNLGRFVLQRSDYDRASKAVEWAQLTAQDQGASPMEVADRSIAGYFERAPSEDPKLADKGLPFWGWANTPSRWLNPKQSLDGNNPADQAPERLGLDAAEEDHLKRTRAAIAKVKAQQAQQGGTDA